MKAAIMVAALTVFMLTMVPFVQVADESIAENDSDEVYYWSEPKVEEYNGKKYTYSTSFGADYKGPDADYTKADMKFLSVKIVADDHRDQLPMEWQNALNVTGITVTSLHVDKDTKKFQTFEEYWTDWMLQHHSIEEEQEGQEVLVPDWSYFDTYPGFYKDVTAIQKNSVTFDLNFSNSDNSGMFAPNLSADFVVHKKNIENIKFEAETVFNWSEISPSTLTFTCADFVDLEVKNGVDFTISDEVKHTFVGTYTDFTITAAEDNIYYYGTNNTTGNKISSWTITPKSILDETVTIEWKSEVPYSGSGFVYNLADYLTITDTQKEQNEGIVDIADGYGLASVDKDVNAVEFVIDKNHKVMQDLKFTITGLNNYCDGKDGAWHIGKINLEDAIISVTGCIFNDEVQQPLITITDSTGNIIGVKDKTPAEINKGLRFKVSGVTEAKDVHGDGWIELDNDPTTGWYHIVITAPSSSQFFTGSSDNNEAWNATTAGNGVCWPMEPADIKDHFDVYLDYHLIYSYKTQSTGVYFKTYDAKTPVLTVRCFFDDREAQVSEGKDYTVEGLTANAGENEITVTGIDNYTGEINGGKITCIIDPIDITGKQVTVNDVYTDLNGQFSYDDLKGNVFIRIGLVPQYGDYDVIAEDGWGVKKEFPASTESTLNYVTVYGTGNLIGVTEGTFNVYPGDQLVQDGVIYKVISEEEKTIGVIGYDAETITEDVEIPYVINGYTVTTIASKAFYGCLTMKTLDLGDVTSIGTKAFTNCKNVTTVVLSNSLKTISAYAFYNCRNLESIDIPDSVKTIGSYAFYKCGALKSIDFGSSITKIGSQAFASVTFVDGETTLKATPKNLAGHSFEGSNKVLKLVA